MCNVYNLLYFKYTYILLQIIRCRFHATLTIPILIGNETPDGALKGYWHDEFYPSLVWCPFVLSIKSEDRLSVKLQQANKKFKQIF